MRVARWLSPTQSEGPGARFALWVQGCGIRCAGCCNPQLFEATGGQELPVSVLRDALGAAAAQVEGVTFLGGEPFEQAASLAELAVHAHSLGLTVMTFTGFQREALESSGDAGVQALLRETDLLVDGRFERDQPETERRWVGSRNQRFHFLSSAYAPGVEQRAQESVDVWVRPDGTVEINGWPEAWGALRRL